METESVEIRGHIIDSLILPRVLDEIVEAGAEYQMATFEVGKSHDDPSYARIEISAERDVLDRLLGRLADLGATVPDTGDVALVPADMDGVFPENFYSTTNLPTQVRIGGEWIWVESPEMDCGIVVDGKRAHTVPM
ncbi:MAG: TIGR00300 family protein, partial [Actinomycetota bacterium]